jgi:hypothetical protein
MNLQGATFPARPGVGRDLEQLRRLGPGECAEPDWSDVVASIVALPARLRTALAHLAAALQLLAAPATPG